MCRDALGKRVTVIVDSGFRRGSAVVKSAVTGAKAGAVCVIDIYREAAHRIMKMTGCRSVDEINADYLTLNDVRG